VSGVLTAGQTGCLAGKLAEDGEKMITNGMGSGSELGIDATK